MNFAITTSSFQDVLSRPADEFENDNLVEEMWAMKAFEHAEVYFNVWLFPFCYVQL